MLTGLAEGTAEVNLFVVHKAGGSNLHKVAGELEPGQGVTGPRSPGELCG